MIALARLMLCLLPFGETAESPLAPVTIENRMAAIQARRATAAKVIADAETKVRELALADAADVAELNKAFAAQATAAAKLGVKANPVTVEAMLFGRAGARGPPGPAGKDGAPGRAPTAAEILAAVTQYFKDHPPGVPAPPPAATVYYFMIVRPDAPATAEFTAYMGLPAWDTLRKAGHKIKDYTLADAGKFVTFPSPPALPCIVTLLEDAATKTSTIVRQPIPLPAPADVLKLPEGIK